MHKNRKQEKRPGYEEAGRTSKRDILYAELNEYQKAGVSLRLNGRPSTSYRIANCVCEKTDYMRDYQINPENKVCAINFDRIRKKDIHTHGNVPPMHTR